MKQINEGLKEVLGVLGIATAIGGLIALVGKHNKEYNQFLSDNPEAKTLDDTVEQYQEDISDIKKKIEKFIKREGYLFIDSKAFFLLYKGKKAEFKQYIESEEYLSNSYDLNLFDKDSNPKLHAIEAQSKILLEYQKLIKDSAIRSLLSEIDKKSDFIKKETANLEKMFLDYKKEKKNSKSESFIFLKNLKEKYEKDFDKYNEIIDLYVSVYKSIKNYSNKFVTVEKIPKIDIEDYGDIRTGPMSINVVNIYRSSFLTDAEYDEFKVAYEKAEAEMNDLLIKKLKFKNELDKIRFQYFPVKKLKIGEARFFSEGDWESFYFSLEFYFNGLSEETSDYIIQQIKREV